MKKILCLAVAALSAVMFLAGCDDESTVLPAVQETVVVENAPAWEWMTDWKAAQARAKAENKPILIDFSGSDWCGWCIKLDEEVFAQPEFQKWAPDHVIPFLADFPRKTPLADDVKMQNQALASVYGIEGFPTVILVRPDGTVIAKTGYQAGGAEKYIAHLEKLLQ